MEVKTKELYQPPTLMVVEVKTSDIICLSVQANATLQEYEINPSTLDW